MAGQSSPVESSPSKQCSVVNIDMSSVQVYSVVKCLIRNAGSQCNKFKIIVVVGIAAS